MRMSEFDASRLSEIARIFEKRPSLASKNENPIKENNNNISSRRLGVGAVKKKVISKEDSVTLTKLLKIGRRKRNMRNENDDQSSSDDEIYEDEDRIESRTSLHSKKKHTRRMVVNSNIKIKKHKNHKFPQNDKNKTVNTCENQTKKIDIKSKDSDDTKLNSIERDSQVGSTTVKRTNNNKKRKRKKSKKVKEVDVN